MYLKLLTILLPLYAASLFAQTEMDELFGDSIEIELESLGGEAILNDLDDVLGKKRGKSFEIRGKQTGEWSVDGKSLDTDKVSFKEQSRSLIDWKNASHETWFNYGTWLQNREYKDNHPDWKVQSRDTSYKELYGKLLKCVGSCKIFRGEEFVNGEFRSNLLEGDEILIEDDSYAWIYLMDGSLLRLSPVTSLSFNEINFSSQSSFKYLRLNYGNIHLRPWAKFEFEKSEGAETDLIMLPLLIKKANREYYAREVFQKKTDLEKIGEHLKRFPGLDSQLKELYELASFERSIATDQKTFIVTPTTSILSTNQFLDVFYQFKEKAFFRIQNGKEFQRFSQKDLEQKAFAYYRGYNNTDKKELEENTWYEMSSDGKEIATNDSFQALYNYNDMFVKRIYSIELARQFWIRKYTKFLMEKTIDESNLAVNFGYRLWNEKEFKLRLNFLEEYTRRVETTNLGSMEKVFSKTGMLAFGERHYKKALKIQIEKLKKLYNKEHMVVKNMNDLDYYVWLLKNAK